MDDFATSFEDADKVVLAEIYAAREKNIHKVSSKTLMNRIKEEDPTKEVYFFRDFEEIANFVYNNAEEGDLVLTMGARRHIQGRRNDFGKGQEILKEGQYGYP